MSKESILEEIMRYLRRELDPKATEDKTLRDMAGPHFCKLGCGLMLSRNIEKLFGIDTLSRGSLMTPREIAEEIARKRGGDEHGEGKR
jgi:hypothetical protein